MFIRKNKNRSGSYSVQLIEKVGRKNRVIKTLGSSKTEDGLAILMNQAKLEMSRLQSQPSLFKHTQDGMIKSVLGLVSNADISIAGPNLVIGKIYDKIGYDKIELSGYFRHLVISRLLFPGSKLKTVDYLFRFQQIELSVDSLYKYMDKLHSKEKSQVEQITFQHTLQILKGKISVVFYDMTTLYFEIDQEDDFRKRGFSKDGKHQNPQIKLGIIVAESGYPIGYDIFEGSTFEGHTLIPVLEQISNKFKIEKPIVVADAGLLSKKNIIALQQAKYQYILGGKIKNESAKIRTKILSKPIEENKPIVIKKENQKIIVSYSKKRAKKDRHNRERGIQRLEKKLQTGKLTKAHINNRGYNKYLKMDGQIAISIDYDKFGADEKWDGLKGYVTNTTLSRKEVITAYRNLWHIEKAFRISKFDLRLRPIYHQIQRRVEAHICICFTAYAVFKELERILKIKKAPFSAARAIELCKTMYQIKVVLPDTGVEEKVLLKMSEEQNILIKSLY